MDSIKYKNMKQILLLLLIVFLATSCQQNNPTPTSSVTYVDEYYEVTISNNTVEGWFQLAGSSALNIHPTTSNGIVNGTFTSPVYSRIDHPTMPLTLFSNFFFHPTDPNSIGCVDIEFKCFVDGSLHEIKNFTLGKVSTIPVVNCSIHGNSYDYDSTW